MRFDPHAYGPEVAEILALGGDGGRPMALAEPKCTSEEARRRIAAAKIPETLRAGLYLYFGCWTEAHETAQDIASREGSYWHAIVHRQEPDAGNAAYWFGQVGSHPVLAELSKLAGDPEELQLAEWQLLFDYCARMSESSR